MSSVIRAFNFFAMLASVVVFGFSPSLFCSWSHGLYVAQPTPGYDVVYQEPMKNIELQTPGINGTFEEYDSFNVTISEPRASYYGIATDASTGEPLFKFQVDAKFKVQNTLENARRQNVKIRLNNSYVGKIIRCATDAQEALGLGSANDKQAWLELEEEFDFKQNSLTFMRGDTLVRWKIQNDNARDFVGAKVRAAKLKGAKIQVNMTALKGGKKYQFYLPGDQLIRIVSKN